MISGKGMQRARDEGLSLVASTVRALLPCDKPADGHIRFPAKRFLEMVEQVRHRW